MDTLVRDDIEDAMQLARKLREEKCRNVYIEVMSDKYPSSLLYTALYPLIEIEDDLTMIQANNKLFIKAFTRRDQ